MTHEPHTGATLWTSSEERWAADIAAVIDTTRRLRDARHVAVMPDVHLARGFCVGTVLATRRLIYPSAVGGDIGCGMLALPIRASADIIDTPLAHRLLRLLPRLIPAHRHRTAAVRLSDGRPRLSDPGLDHVLHREGVCQLGSLGSGNHFVELQRDADDGRLWLMVHSGSRGLGQAISGHHLGQADGRSHGRPFFDSASHAGKAYLHDVRVARAYARLSRATMTQAVAFAFSELADVTADWGGAIHTDHNHVRREHVDGEWLWVHRKGAAPALDGQPGVIPGSMGSASYHVVGQGHALSLRSSSHGAGRAMDRAAARRRIDAEALRRSMDGVWFDRSAAARLTDEAPSAYKDIDHVLRLQRGQVRVLRRLLPVLNYKGA